jgi:tetratricopeptide (TPR) repeat protein
LERLLAEDTGAGTPARARVLLTLASHLIYRSGHAAALPYIRECLALSRTLGRTAMLAQALCLLGQTYRTNLAEARAAAEEAVVLAREVGDPAVLLRAYFVLGAAACWQGDLEMADTALREAVSWGRRSSIAFMTGAPLRELGHVAYRRRDYPTARLLLDESLKQLSAMGMDAVKAQTLPILGRVALAEGKADEAERWFRETLTIERVTGSATFVAVALSGLAAVALARGEPEHAVRLYSGAAAIGTETAALGELYLGEHTEPVARLRAQLGRAFDAVWAEGATITLQEALSGNL